MQNQICSKCVRLPEKKGNHAQQVLCHTFDKADTFLFFCEMDLFLLQ